MDLPALQAYAQTVSTSIGLQNVSITSAKAIQAQYDYLILTSQSTITGIQYETIANSNLMIAANIRSNAIVQSNIILDSSINECNSTIVAQIYIMSNADKTISSLALESAGLTSSLVQSDINFNSTAVQYSSLYMVFMAKDQAYQTCVRNIETTSTLLKKSIEIEQISYANWQTSTAFAVAKSGELSTLYLNSNAIQSTLTQYKVDETNAISQLASTNNGIMAVSSLYATALVNQQYYQSLSSQSAVLEDYTRAYSTFTSASALATASPTNTVAATAKTMAQQRLSTLTVSKTQSEAEVTALQALVAGATTDTYATTLAAAEAAIQLESANVATFQGYMNSSIAAVSYLSTLYEQAGQDVASSLAAVALYSTFYTSSVAGSNALMASAAADTSTIATQQLQLDTVSMTLSSLNIQYANYASSYSGWVSYSSLMTQEYTKAIADIISYSTMYESTTVSAKRFSDTLTHVNSSITGNMLVIHTKSTIMQFEAINMLGYETQIAACFNLEEGATYKYRETFVRQKRLDAQKYYDLCVLQQVQATSTQNGTLLAQAGAAAFTPVTINLTTPVITLAYNNLTTISAFLTTFTNMYGNYDTQTVNLQAVSSSVGIQAASFSTLTTYSDQFRMNPAAGPSFSNAQADFVAKQVATVGLQSNVTLTQAQINAAKTGFLTTYRAVFQSSDIIANESTISSFLIQGFNTAVTPEEETPRMPGTLVARASDEMLPRSLSQTPRMAGSLP
jgi:hypothetical protein